MEDTAQADKSAGPTSIDMFIEQIGEIGRRFGMPRISGRILGLLMVNEDPMSLQAMADRLLVSRASISTNARNLAEIGLIERAPAHGERQDYYRLGADHYASAADRLAALMDKSADSAGRALSALPVDLAFVQTTGRELIAVLQAAARSLRGCLGDLRVDDGREWRGWPPKSDPPSRT